MGGAKGEHPLQIPGHGHKAPLAAHLVDGPLKQSFLVLALLAVLRLDWSSAGRSVVAAVQARDPSGAQFTLAYELDIVQVAGRWEVSAVQVNPDA